MDKCFEIKACEGVLRFRDDGENLWQHSGHIGEHCIPPTQRRTLLSHLLAAEGLPVEVRREDE